jgi:hypothetical protein
MSAPDEKVYQTFSLDAWQREPTSLLDWRTANVDHESLIHDTMSTWPLQKFAK